MALGGFVDVVGDLQADRDHQVELVERPPGPGGTGLQMIKERRRGLGHKCVAEPAVRHLAGEGQVLRAQGGQVDGNGGRGRHRPHGPSCPAGARDLERRPAMLQAVAAGHHAHDLDGLPGRRRGDPNRTPCQPSMICGPLTPRPSRKRPPDKALNDKADMASTAGVRVPIWAMPEARRSVDVRPAR